MSVPELAEQLDFAGDESQPRKKRGRPPKKLPETPEEVIVALDLGNATTLVAYLNKLGQKVVVPDPDGQLCTRSVVGLEDGDPDKPLCGRAACNYGRVHPEHCGGTLKRARGHGDVVGIVDKNGRAWTVAELEALFLRWRLKHFEELTGFRIAGVLATVPADFNDAQRRATLDIVEKAGYKGIGTVNEPTAAVIAYCIGKTGVFMVLDIGGGTTDVSIIRVEEGDIFSILATAGRDDLGGREFTSAILDFCLEHALKNGVALDPENDARDIALLEVECENAKLDLASQECVILTFRAKDRLFDLTLTRPKFEELVAHLCEEIHALANETFRKANLNPEDIDAVVMAGGSARMPCARARVEAMFGPEKVKRDIDVDKAVVLGAIDVIGMKIQERIAQGDVALAGQLDTYQIRGEIEVREVLGQALGIAAIELSTRREMMAPIVLQGSSLPSTTSRLFGLLHGNLGNTNATVTVLQGNDLDNPKNNDVLAEFPMTGLPAGPTDERIRVTFAVDTNGLVDVHAVDTHSGKEITGQVDARGAITERAAM